MNFETKFFNQIQLCYNNLQSQVCLLVNSEKNSFSIKVNCCVMQKKTKQLFWKILDFK